MKADQNTKLFMEARKDMYQFFSRIFILEVNKELFDRMKQMKYPKVSQNSDFSAGYEKLKEYFDAHDDSDVVNLEVDYARIFLAGGVAQGLAAFPYESVYTNKKHLTDQEAACDVTVLYGAKGLAARADMYRIPNDHIGLEFEYMAILCQEAADAAQTGDEALLEKSIKEQESFCRGHMEPWMTALCDDVIKYAGTGFYQAIGILCRGFVREEIRMFI